MTITAGVVAVQGDAPQHVAALERAGATSGRKVRVREIRTAGVVPDCDVVTLPGGESTTIARLLRSQGIDEELREHIDRDKPFLATCAGLIVLATDIDPEVVSPLGLVDIGIERNAFGRQRDSFEAGLDITGLDDPFPGVFIRAPVVADPRETEVLARVGEHAVAIRDGSLLGTAFHPELAADSRVHELALFEPIAD